MHNILQHEQYAGGDVTGSSACGDEYHNLSTCDFPYSPASNCSDTYMALQKPAYLTLCLALFVVGAGCMGHLGYRIFHLRRLGLPMPRIRFPLSLYLLSTLFCFTLILRSIDIFGYAGKPLCDRAFVCVYVHESEGMKSCHASARGLVWPLFPKTAERE